MQSARLGEVVDFRSRVVKLGRRLCFIEVVASVGERVVVATKLTKSVLTC